MGWHQRQNSHLVFIISAQNSFVSTDYVCLCIIWDGWKAVKFHITRKLTFVDICSCRWKWKLSILINGAKNINGSIETNLGNLKRISITSVIVHRNKMSNFIIIYINAFVHLNKVMWVWAIWILKKNYVCKKRKTLMKSKHAENIAEKACSCLCWIFFNLSRITGACFDVSSTCANYETQESMTTVM